jgi:hypothetical protein
MSWGAGDLYRGALKEAENLAMSGGDEDLHFAFVPADPSYPARLRAYRLSWFIWAVIGEQTVGVNSYEGSPLQVCIIVWACIGVKCRRITNQLHDFELKSVSQLI